MALATYANLQTAIADWLNRQDLTSVIPDFITNAEARINSRIRVRDMETTVSVTFDANGEYSLPADYLEWRFVVVNSTPVMRPEFAEPDSAEFMYKFRPNLPSQYFTILGTKLRLQPAYAGTGTFVYYAKVPSLSVSATTNWLLTKAPDVYLYAALTEAAFYLRDETGAVGYSQKFDAALNSLQVGGRAAHLSRQQGAVPGPSARTLDMAGTLTQTGAR